MKKKILSVLLALAMVMSIGVTAAVSTGASMPFKDVKKSAWYYDAVQTVYDYGIMKGKTDTTFEPEANMTRAELVTILARLAKADVSGLSTELKFTDTVTPDWYSDDVGWAVKEGLVGGYDDNTFRPNAQVLRQEIVVLLDRFVNYLGLDVKETPLIDEFADKASIPSWAAEAAESVRASGLMGGANGNLNPTNPATRAEIATIVKRIIPYLSVEKSVQAVFNDFLDANSCYHGGIHMFMGHNIDFTAEKIGGYILKNFTTLDPDKYEFQVNADDVAEALTGLQGAGEGQGGFTNLRLKLYDKTTGKASEEESFFISFTKFFAAEGERAICPDEGLLENALADFSKYVDVDAKGNIKLSFSSVDDITIENLSAQIISQLGISTNAYQIGFEDETALDAIKALVADAAGETLTTDKYAIAIRNLPNEANLYGTHDPLTYKNYSFSITINAIVNAD